MCANELKDTLLRMVRNCSDKSVDFPESLSFTGTIDNPIMTLGFSREKENSNEKINAVIMNMQKDAAAFEVWSIVLWKFAGCKTVTLEWTEPEGNAHYERFLYRASFFKTLFRDRFLLKEKYLDMVESRRVRPPDTNNLINTPNKEEPSDTQKSKSEAEMEGKLYRYLKDKCKEYHYAEQIPVGVFHNQISKNKENAVFPRGKSAIDLVGVSHKGDDLRIYELKLQDNNGLGVISELLCYMAIMKDVCVENIRYSDEFKHAKGSRQKLVEHLRNYQKNIQRIMGEVVIAGQGKINEHPLLAGSIAFLDSHKFIVTNVQKDIQLAFRRAHFTPGDALGDGAHYEPQSI